MLTYRIEVGRNDQVEPSNIVGAIANEADISSQYIGQIILHDDHSTVELPDGMPDDVFKHLKKARVRSKALNISIAKDGDNATSARAPRPNKGPKKSKVPGKDNPTNRKNSQIDGSAPLKKKKKTYTKKDKR